MINCVKQKEDCSNWLDTSIDDTKFLLTSRPLWSLEFVHIKGNIIAHLLAKYRLSLIEERVWIEDYPTVISLVISLLLS